MFNAEFYTKENGKNPRAISLNHLAKKYTLNFFEVLICWKQTGLFFVSRIRQNCRMVFLN